MYKNKGGRHFWFAENLIKAKYDATVFCANTYHNKSEFIDTGKKKYTTDILNNIPFVFVKTTAALDNGFDRIKNMVVFYWNLFSVAKAYAKEHGKPDVIIASSVHPLTMVAGIQIAKKMNVPCICEIRDLWPEAIFAFNMAKENSLVGKLLTKGEHWIYRKADALIFTKEGDIDYLKEHRWTTETGGDIDLGKCNYINNGVNIHVYKRQIETEILSDDDLADESAFNMVYAGTIRPVNNVGNILDCAALLKNVPGCENIRFLIYGEGSELEALRQRTESENLTNVRLKGFVERRYIPYILSRSSVNILNYSQTQYNWSRGNSSNKLFEYMASGKPVISTVKMGYSIIKKYKCGIELDESTPEKLAESIKKMHDMSSDEYAKLGENASKGANDFDFNVLTDKLLSVIDSVLK